MLVQPPPTAQTLFFFWRVEELGVICFWRAELGIDGSARAVFVCLLDPSMLVTRVRSLCNNE